MKISSASNAPLETLLFSSVWFWWDLRMLWIFWSSSIPKCPWPASVLVYSSRVFLRCNHLPSLKTRPVHNTAESALFYTVTLNHVHVFASLMKLKIISSSWWWRATQLYQLGEYDLHSPSYRSVINRVNVWMDHKVLQSSAPNVRNVAQSFCCCPSTTSV